MVGLMAGTAREQALSLLASAKNHPDLAVKISSLKQAKEILISAETSLVSQSVPHIQELQSSPESLVRKFLVELVEELALKAAEQSSALLSVLLSFLKDDAPAVVRQSIISGTNIFCRVLEEIALQFQQSGKVEGWLEESWLRMVNFKDVVYSIASEPGSVGTKSLAMKFIEILVLLTTPETNGSEASTSFQMKEEKVRNFNVSWITGGNPILDSAMLTLEANKGVGLLLDQLQSASLLRGSLIIVLINCFEAVYPLILWHYCGMLTGALMWSKRQYGDNRLDLDFRLTRFGILFWVVNFTDGITRTFGIFVFVKTVSLLHYCGTILLLSAECTLYFLRAFHKL